VRHLDRMRMGMALAALLFCMTSSAMAMSGKQKTTLTPEDPASHLATLCNVTLTDDGSLQWFDHLGAKVPVVVLRYNEGKEFDELSAAVSEAKVVQDGHGTPIQSMVFYERTGQVDRLFYVTDTNLLFDPGTHQYFRPNAVVMKFLDINVPE
jgi:hypothetical protein